MPRLMIECPDCGTDVYTGMTVDVASLDKCQFNDNWSRCAPCNIMICWSTSEAYFEKTK